MTAQTTHDEMRAVLAAEALGALDGEERALLAAHLDVCDACRAELEELRRAAALTAYAAPARTMEPARAARVRGRLLARAAADRDVPDTTLVAPAPPLAAVSPVPAVSPPVRAAQDDDDVTRVTPIAPRRRAPVLPWLAAAASLALLLGVGGYALSLRGRLAAATEEVAAVREERSELKRALGEREATLAAVAAPAVRVIDMASAGQAQPGGRMFWDPRTDRWTFFAHDLPAVARGRAYQLWFITPGGRKIPAPTFRPGPRGEATVQATYALPADSLGAVAVTEEPEGGLPQPSGEVVIVGAMSSR